MFDRIGKTLKRPALAGLLGSALLVLGGCVVTPADTVVYDDGYYDSRPDVVVVERRPWFGPPPPRPFWGYSHRPRHRARPMDRSRFEGRRPPPRSGVHADRGRGSRPGVRPDRGNAQRPVIPRKMERRSSERRDSGRTRSGIRDYREGESG